jgi:hypothetical protein
MGPEPTAAAEGACQNIKIHMQCTAHRIHEYQ